MNLRNGKLTNSAKPVPKRRYNKKMVVAASAGGEEDPPQGSGTVAPNATNVSTSTKGAQAIPVSTGSEPAGSSQAMIENTSTSTGTIPISVSTTAPPFAGTSEIPPVSTNSANHLSTPGPSFAVDGWRQNMPYGMPYSYMAGLRGTGPTYTTTNQTAFSPNMGSVGRSAHNTGLSAQIPPMTTSTQAAFQPEMDASNQDMVGLLSRELGTIFNPIAASITRSSQDSAETYQRLSSQLGRMADFLGVPQNRRRNNQSTYQEEDPIIEQIRNIVPPPRPNPVVQNPAIELGSQIETTETSQP